MTRTDLFISAVVPLHNDADIVDGFLTELWRVLSDRYTNYEIILVDDGSTDATAGIIEPRLEDVPCVRLLRLTRRFGREIAISAGLETAIGDYVAVLLPETDPPDGLPVMIEHAVAGANVVFGVRAHRHGQSLLHRLGAAAFYWISRNLLDLRVPANTTHFRVLSRQAVNALTRIPDRNRYLASLSTHVGYATQSVAYEPTARRQPPRQLGLPASVRLAVDIIIANSTHPLRLASGLGLAAALLDLLYGIYIVVIYLFKDDVVEGWVTQSMQTAIMFFFLFLLLSVISEYLVRLLDEVKQGPLYFVAEEKQSSVLIFEERSNIATDSTA